MIDLPWLAPGLLLAMIVSIVAGPRVGRELGAGTLIGALMVFSLGMIVSATLTPQSAALEFGARGGGTCDFTLVGLPSLSDFLSLNEITLNMLLFLPLGATIGVVPRSRRKVALIIAVVLLPFVIEWMQLVIPVLDRACEVSDIVYNLTGLALGMAIAWVGIRVYRD